MKNWPACARRAAYQKLDLNPLFFGDYLQSEIIIKQTETEVRASKQQGYLLNHLGATIRSSVKHVEEEELRQGIREQSQGKSVFLC